MILKSLTILTVASLMLGCSNPDQQNTNTSLVSDKLNLDCTWKKEVLQIPFNEEITVSFDHETCTNDGAAIIFTSEPYDLETKGIKINSAYADVIYDYFNIFEKTDLNTQDFLQTLIKKHIDHEGECKPKQVSKNIWAIEDGLAANEQIRFMPCGRYGRNVSGQTIFQINDIAILHFNTPSLADEINKTSIKLERRQK